jgi:hypothetical protein
MMIGAEAFGLPTGPAPGVARPGQGVGMPPVTLRVAPVT